MKVPKLLPHTGCLVSALLVLSQSATAQTSTPIAPTPASIKTAPYDSASLVVHPMWVTGYQKGSRIAASTAATSSVAKPHVTPAAPTIYFPGDLSNPNNDQVVISATSHNLYVDCTPGCWGTPGPQTFLANLGASDFIHLVDQYIGSTANNRYQVGSSGLVSYPIFTALNDNDILNIVHASAIALNVGGYHNIFHVFLPQGVDVCSTGSGCYSPDNPNNFTFCAYHSSVTFKDIGHILFTVEPYQNVLGCSVAPGSPNGSLIDSTANNLSHELFETITDPDGTAWFQYFSLALLGDEIADECQVIEFIGQNAYFVSPPAVLNGVAYEVQAEYSNKYHGCAFVP
jgi:hypothetical protein